MDLVDFQNYLAIILKDKLIKVVISNSVDKKYQRIEIENKGDRFLVSSFSHDKVFHTKLSQDKIGEFIIENLKFFRQYNFFGVENQYMIKISKKEKIFFSKTKNAVKAVNFPTLGNNKLKNYLLKEGEVIEPLVDMGIFTKDGKIINAMYDKYRQINRIIEIIDDYVKELDLKEINIIDFGCGKSYLTFVIYYYFNKLKNIKTNIVGLDLKSEVIDNCNIAAKKYGYEGLTFKLGDINGYQCDFPVDMVITLHACYIATDYALYNAVKWKAKMIFSVPCCQHEVNAQIKSNTYSILTRYGIAKERISAIYTDVVRCNLLSAMSYKVQLLEFIDFDHTPKNLLIRAKLTAIPSSVREKMLLEVENLMQEFNFSQKLYALLSEEGLIKSQLIG